MNQTMIDNWNRVVMPNDKVYHLGDFTFGNPRNIEKFAKQLNGHKRLVLGNHDYEAKLYYPYFEKVMSWRQFGGKQFKRPVVLTHFPLHESSFAYRTGSTGVNIHGHIHQNKLPLPWVNVCVEHRQYTPISIEDLLDSI
jgi:calcineurin-like phosphoesterase family protein